MAAASMTRVLRLLSRLPASVHRLGGSHAQRDVLQLTLQRSIERAGGLHRRRTALRIGRRDRRLARPWGDIGINVQATLQT